MRHVRPAALALVSLLAATTSARAQPRGPEGKGEPTAAKDALVPPVLQEFVDAPYPPEAEAAKREGVVILQLDVDVAGAVTAAVVLSPAGSGFDEAALAASRKFRFAPATRNGKPVPSRITFRYTFTLKAAPTPEGTPAAPKDERPRTALRGVVDIGSTGVHLRGAVVTVRGPDGFAAELTTGEDGAWVVRDLPAGRYSVSVRAAGFEGLAVDEEVELGQSTEVLYRLQASGGGSEIIVQGERPPREVTKRTLERREVARIPGTNGDALRAIQNLPGVARPPAIAGFLIVRGSAPNDTQIFIDGALVPLAYHFGGLSSVVPTELIDRLDFYPGNFSVQYGRVMGGIVDVGLRSPTTDGKYHGLAQIDLIDGRFMLEGPLPIFKEKNVRFVVGGRRSWVDTWLKPTLEAAGAGVTSAPVYYDYQAFVEAEPTPRSKLRAGFYGSDDRLEILIRSPLAADPVLGGNIGLHTGFWRAQATYQNDLGDDTRLRGMFSYGKNTVEFSLGAMFFTLYSQQISSRLELSRRLARGVTLNVGQDLLWAPYDLNVRAPRPPRPGEPDPGPFAARPPLVVKESTSLYRPAAYAEAEIAPTDRARIVAGYRVDYAKDTQRWDASPRANGRIVVVPAFPKTTVKGGVGVFHQPPQPQETNLVFGTPGLRSNRAIHYSLGVEQELTRKIDVSLEGFYKQLDGLVSRAPSTSGGFDYTNQGSGYVVGAETLLRYKADSRFFGWVAYTLSRSVRRAAPGEPLRLFQYDQTHILTALGSYRLGRGWEFGLRFRFVSGPLDQPCLGGILNSAAGAYACVQGPGFTERLPSFHQLDLRLDKTWVYTGGWKLHTYLDVLNVYNRQSPEGLQYNYNFSQSTYQTGLPLIPSLGVRAEF